MIAPLYIPVLLKTKLFQGVSPEELSAMLQCLSAAERNYEKGDYLLRIGEVVDFMGIVLKGRIQIIQEDFWGNRNIVSLAEPGELFAEAYACVPGAPLGVSVVADTACSVLSMDIQKVLSTCENSCTFHARLIQNLLSTMAEKNLQLSHKVSFLAQRSTRKKLLSYLSAQSQRAGSPVFTIPFDRQELADFLSVDRSAMSSELGRLRDTGVLTFQKNQFELFTPLDELD